MIRKNSQQIGNKGMYLNIVKAIYDKPTVNIIIIDEKLKVVPLIAGAKQRSPLLFFFFGGGGQRAMWLVGFQFSDQGSNSSPQH